YFFRGRNMSKRRKLRANRDLPTNLVRLQVPCNGTMHEVLYQPNRPQKPGRPPRRGGSLSFPAHTRDKLQRALNFAELGGKPCGCVKVLLAWRSVVVHGDKVKLPVALVPAARDAIRRRGKRLRARNEETKESAIYPLHERPGFLFERINR